MYILLGSSIILGVIIYLTHICFCNYPQTDFITQQTDINIKESNG